jgi:hypothetical protein
MNRHFGWRGALVLSAVAGLQLPLLGGCAFDVMSVKQIPAQLETGAVGRSSFELGKDASVSPAGGFSRTLRQGTHWTFVGSIKQGDAYKTSDQVLTVEASNIQEAYIVVDATNKLVGFYIPVEKTFAPASQPVGLDVRPTDATRN